MNDFKIKLGAINGGENYFLFEIKDQFFEEFILSDVEHANIKATAFLDKEGDRLGLTLTIDGKINKLLCDICTDEISVDITAMTKVIIKTTDEDLVSAVIPTEISSVQISQSNLFILPSIVIFSPNLSPSLSSKAVALIFAYSTSDNVNSSKN